ncbi:MAG TPA: type II toxin-antitoxin system prevent-host-death family antitoxin [Polyangiaceae bacterium]|jgi:prevent-host-death family protein|nr:type II toxin-antitoxin system prevent-host-death family antitoxin [Polyangiaceae bacterium]
MARIVNMHEAKTMLSKLVAAAEAGEEVILARAGKPVARLVPLRKASPRRLGCWKGKVRMAKDFDAPLSDEDLAAWGLGK